MTVLTALSLSLSLPLPLPPSPLSPSLSLSLEGGRHAPEPVAKSMPAGEWATEMTEFWCPWRISTGKVSYQLDNKPGQVQFQRTPFSRSMSQQARASPLEAGEGSIITPVIL